MVSVISEDELPFDESDDERDEFIDAEFLPADEPDACEECGGEGRVIYDSFGEGPIPCKKCNGRGF